jgi:hypothetical protein
LRIAFKSYRDLNDEIYVMNADGSGAVRLTNNAPPGNTLPQDWFPDWQPTPAPVATSFFTVTPCRVFDTREVSGPTLGAPLTCGTVQSFAVAGECGVPASAEAVSLNLTGTGSTAQGNLRLFASGTPAPLASSLNYAAGQTRANNAVAPLSAGGQISVLCSPSGTTHVVLDVNGYFQ